MRDPIATGTYYQGGETLLSEEIEASYHNKRGPGALPIAKQEEKVQAIIAPNSPYPHCAPCAAWSYKELAETPTPDLYIVISGNHHSVESGVTTETFVTPLGMVRVDQDFARGLVEKGTVSYDDEIHNRDHGIEVQLPYLQFAKKKELEKLKILPLLVSTDIDLKKLALDIKEVLMEQNKHAIFIISSDFLRHGPMFHYVRYLEDAQKNVYDFDARGIDLIKAQNADGWFSYIDKNFAPIDGTLPITLLLQILKKCTVNLEQYYTSGDILNEQKNTVSYAAIVFQE
jgi:AmmeMemoRadiSam system protein B